MSDAEAQREPDQLDGVRLPEQQASLVGHEGVRATLAELIAQRRIPGGILLHGPHGIGKATLAFDAARQILSATGDEDAHRVAEQVHSGSHPNVFVLRRGLNKTRSNFATSILVGQIARRDDGDPNPLRDRIHQTRGRAGYRVCVIDSIDDCTPSAANALLKLLEEPPPETVFLLVSHRPQALLPTIRSRCQSLAMRPLSDAAVKEVLLDQRPNATEAVLARAIELAEGRPRRGFEALGLGEDSPVGALKGWLGDPGRHAAAVHLAIADKVATGKKGAELAFARDILLDWIAAEARDAATGQDRARLASANRLWEKANASFADTEEYNLDVRQTLVGILDAIRRHTRPIASAEPR